MTARSLVIVLSAVLLVTVLATSVHAEPPAAETQKIETLIKHLESLTDAKFIRNGTAYSAASAAKFLRGKWDSQADEISTAQEFIDKIASTSSTTGKPYLIRFKDGTEKKSGEYLSAELKKL